MKKINKSTSLVVKSQSADVLISQAINKGVSVETMTGLYELDKRWKADRSREAYFQALSSFQGECPIIKKSKSVNNSEDKGGGKRYSYAPLDEIVKQVSPILAKYGLSYSITVAQDEKSVEAKVRSTHIAGHSEETGFKVPIDEKAYMNAPQKFASALTFAKRYAFCNAFGILTGDEDNDAITAGGVKSSISTGKVVPTPHSTPKTGKETAEEAYQKVAKMLMASSNIDVLITYSEKLAKEKSKIGFTKKQIAGLQAIISGRVNELEK
jgi:hypothetical protein